MRPIDKTSETQSECISLEFDLQHSPAKVWRALTDPTLLAEWLLPAVGFSLAPGATFKLQAPPKPGWDGIVNCRLVEIEAGEKLTWSWVVGEIDTVVTFRLISTDAGTRLTIVQTGFKPGQEQNFAGARYGWKMMSEKLGNLLERTRP